jgi:flagellar basal-body rod modification protein FlgD
MSAIPSAGSSKDIKGDYMMLLVTQLQNQNPLEPMSSDEMTAQLTQLSQLEHMENMDSTFEKALFTAQMNQGAALIDKEVTFVPHNSDQVASGRVDGITTVDGKVIVGVGSQGIDIDRILSVAK